MSDTSPVDAPLRFRLRADALYVNVDGGVALHHDNGFFTVRGAGVSELVASLFRTLDGRRTLADAFRGVDPRTRAAVDRLVAALDANGFLIPVSDTLQSIPDWAAQHYAQHLAYLSQYPGCPVTRLNGIRSRTVGVLGHGAPLRALAGACADLGFAQVVLSGGDALADVVKAVADRDSGCRWTLLPDAGGGIPLLWDLRRPELSVADAVLVGLERPETTLLADVQTELATRGVLFGAVTPVGELLVAAVAGADADWCWNCLTRSVATSPAANSGTRIPPPAATLAALHVAHRVFSVWADVPTPDHAAATIHPATLSTRQHALVRDPLCPRHAGFFANSEDGPVATGSTGQGEDAVREDVPGPASSRLGAVNDRILVSTQSWTDPVTGPVRMVGELDLSQLPLAGSRCEFRPAGIPLTVECRGISARETRNQVVLAALAEWGAEVVRLRGGPGGAVDAGWSIGEARYRALTRASLALARGPGRKTSVGDLGRPLRRMLLAVLEESTGLSVHIEELPSGLVRATVSGNCGLCGRAVGLTSDHALDAALLAAITARLPGNDHVPVTVAQLMPPTTTWTQAVNVAMGRALRRPAFADATALLPFARGKAWLTACQVEGAP